MESFGKTFNEFIGHTANEIFGDEFFNEVIKPHAELCLKGEEINYHAWFNFPESEPRYMDVYYHPYKEKSGEVTGFVVSAWNITERKQVEEALAEEHAQHNEAQRIAHLGHWVLDLVKNDLSGQMRYTAYSGKSPAQQIHMRPF